MSIFDVPYLAPILPVEKAMESVVTTVVDKIQHGRARVSQAQASELGQESQKMRDICRSWSTTCFDTTSHIWYGLCQKGVPVKRIEALLPYVETGAVERRFDVHTSGGVKKTRSLSIRQRSFALGLFRKHFLQFLADQILEEFGLSFEGSVDLAGACGGPAFVFVWRSLRGPSQL